MTNDLKAVLPFSAYAWLDLRDFRNEMSECVGWSPLVAKLLRDIDHLVADGPAKVRLWQVKEKLGELRFYYRLEGGDERLAADIDALVMSSRHISRSTCIRCGATGKVVDMNGWFAAMCEEHARDPKFRFRSEDRAARPSGLLSD